MTARTLILAGLTGLAALSACSTSPQARAAHATVHVDTLTGLQSAIDNAHAGDTVVLAAGTYRQHEPIRITGRSDITVRGATDDYDDTVIRGPGIDDSRLQSNIRLDNADDITIKDLTVADSYYHGIQINNDSDGFTADNVHTLDNGESGFKVTSPSNGSGPAAYSDDGRIENCRINFSDTGHRSVVEGVDLVAVRHWQVIDNAFDHIWAPDGGPAYAAFAKGNSQDVVFADNRINDSFIGLSFGGGGTQARYFRNGDTRVESRGGVIRNNTVYDTRDVGIYMNRAEDFTIRDNTVLDNGPATGSINVRYPQSSGRIEHNRTTGEIRMRDGARAQLEDNSRVTLDH